MTDQLIDALKNSNAFPHDVQGFDVLQTHISWVLLTGPYAYKIKKPIDFGFLDFSTLEKRRFFCDEEIRLNRRLAPKLYLETVPIYGTHEAPSLHPVGDIIEYAVKMRQFDQAELLDAKLGRNELTPELIDKLADIVATFHHSQPSLEGDNSYGTPEQAHQLVSDNFSVVKPFLTESEFAELSVLQEWAEQTYQDNLPRLKARKAKGYIKECHGDMHLGNVALFNNEVTIFDCIEFKPAYRCIDTISDTLFLMMDLLSRDLSHYAYRFFNRYLESTGDYVSLPLFRYYLSYRAMVRAKIAILRLNQGNVTAEESQKAHELYQSYLSLAQRHTTDKKGALIIMNGVTGSGKSTVSQYLCEHMQAIRIRADVERKRLFGFAATDDTKAAGTTDIYTKEATHKTFEHIKEIALTGLQSGLTMIVDATFIRKALRDEFASLAKSHDIPFCIVRCDAKESSLKQSIAKRSESASDPSEGSLDVLALHLKTQDPLTPDEQRYSVTIKTDENEPIKTLINDIRVKLAT